MEQLPFWAYGATADKQETDTVVVDRARTLPAFWVARSLASTPRTEDEEMEVVARIGLAALIAAPMRPIDGEFGTVERAGQRNRGYAAGLMSNTLLANGLQLFPTRITPLLERAERQVRSGEVPLTQVIKTLASALRDLGPEVVDAFRLDPDTPGTVFPVPFKTYLATPLTGFRDVAPEWLWTRGIDGPPGAKADDGRWDDSARSARATLGHDHQLELNDRVVELLRALGLDVFVPHENFDPKRHSGATPSDVDHGDRVGVAGADLVLHLGDFPTTGGGKELVLNENNLGLTITMASPDVHTSRFVSGTRHAYSEIMVDGAWPAMAADAVLADLPRHLHHAAVRRANVAAAKELLDVLPDNPVLAGDTLLTTRRARQLRDQPELLYSASMLEIQELAHHFGYELNLMFKRVPQGHAEPVIDFDTPIEELVTGWVNAKSGLKLDAPNSAEQLRRAAGISKVIQDPDLGHDGMTVRDEHGNIEIHLGSQPPKRSRFTLAHEVAHVLLEGEQLTVSHRGGPGPEKIERRVDALAAALLLPGQWLDKFRAELRSLGVPKGSMGELHVIAARVDVNIDVAAMRLTHVEPDDPTIVLRAEWTGSAWVTRYPSGMPDAWYGPSGGAMALTGLGHPDQVGTNWTGPVHLDIANVGVMSATAWVEGASSGQAVMSLHGFRKTK